MGEAAYTNLLLDRAGAVATLTLNRPRAANALDTTTLRELARAVREVRRDAAIHVLVVTGAGERAFSAGADIGAMAAMSGREGHAYSQLGHRVMASVEALPIPVIAAVNGVALGGGLELALACDLIVASSRARLGLPEINLGLIPGFGGTQRLALRVGPGRAREMIYRGHRLDAEEALAARLVDRVVAPEAVAGEAARLAADLAAKPPLALRQAKAATAFGATAPLAAGCRYEIEAFGVVFGSEDRSEGLRAFLDKRSPVWKGR
jgi:enoyl-CoA hydratase